MRVMPANASGWFWHSLARETSRLGHLYSPKGQRGPWPWISLRARQRRLQLLGPKTNTFDTNKWASMERQWHQLIVWAQAAPLKPLWAIVPDVPGDAARTLDRWTQYATTLRDIPAALAVQDGMEVDDVKALAHQPQVIAVGGTTEWKWRTVERWAAAFPRVHLLRCNSPARLYELEAMGVESCDGTGWSRGDRKQTAGLEEWARSRAAPVAHPLWPHVCRAARDPLQETFA